MIEKKIAIIGCGNLGKSILNGLVDANIVPVDNIIATKRSVTEECIKDGIRYSSNNEKAIQDSDIIIMALKPYNILLELESLKQHFDPKRHILISVASGVSIGDFEEVVGHELPLFRVMPNTSADVGMSMSCISTNTENDEIIKLVESCFNAIGSTIVIDERLMDSATVLGACGIAYVLRFMRAMTQGGIQIGFDAKTANKIVTQTVKGAAELLIQRNQHPEYEIDKVTTPKGCTIAGLNEMEHNGFSSALIKGITKSFDEIK
ncbi:MAG: pyrroline-5-carboxylate reductase [Marinifilaceae bacterium]|jgi:pyrroline-5-carboxylate reductase|nr:pyrroline-5-carboxylate reductase [Marinifilaceae bacterium]